MESRQEAPTPRQEGGAGFSWSFETADKLPLDLIGAERGHALQRTLAWLEEAATIHQQQIELAAEQNGRFSLHKLRSWLSLLIKVKPVNEDLESNGTATSTPVNASLWVRRRNAASPEELTYLHAAYGSFTQVIGENELDTSEGWDSALQIGRRDRLLWEKFFIPFGNSPTARRRLMADSIHLYGAADTEMAPIQQYDHVAEANSQDTETLVGMGYPPEAASEVLKSLSIDLRKPKRIEAAVKILDSVL